MSNTKKHLPDRQNTMATSTSSYTTAKPKTLAPTSSTTVANTPTAATTLKTTPTPTQDLNSSPSPLLELPAHTDTLETMVIKMEALAAVVERGQSIAVATGRPLTVSAAEMHSIPGAAGRLSQAEVAELLACRAAIDISTEVHARTMREMRVMTKKYHEISERMRSRLRSLQAMNPKSKHFGKTPGFPSRGRRTDGGGDGGGVVVVVVVGDL